MADDQRKTLPAPGFSYNPRRSWEFDRPAGPTKCECGAEKAGCGPNSHSDWCPKHAIR